MRARLRWTHARGLVPSGRLSIDLPDAVKNVRTPGFQDH